jgi:hypothetical protein
MKSSVFTLPAVSVALVAVLTACPGKPNTNSFPSALGQTPTISGTLAPNPGASTLKGQVPVDFNKPFVEVLSSKIDSKGAFSIILPDAAKMSTAITPPAIADDPCNKSLTVSPVDLKGNTLFLEVFDDKNAYIGAASQVKLEMTDTEIKSIGVSYLYLSKDGSFKGTCNSMGPTGVAEYTIDVAGKAGWNTVILTATILKEGKSQLSIKNGAIPSGLTWTFIPAPSSFQATNLFTQAAHQLRQLQLNR